MLFDSLQAQEKEEENPATEEPAPAPTDRKGHEPCGQVGLASLQSERAVELAGAAPEKEQGRQVRPAPRGASWGGLLSPCESLFAQQQGFLCNVLFLTSKTPAPIL